MRDNGKIEYFLKRPGGRAIKSSRFDKFKNSASFQYIGKGTWNFYVLESQYFLSSPTYTMVNQSTGGTTRRGPGTNILKMIRTPFTTSILFQRESPPMFASPARYFSFDTLTNSLLEHCIDIFVRILTRTFTLDALIDRIRINNHHPNGGPSAYT